MLNKKVLLEQIKKLGNVNIFLELTLRAWIDREHWPHEREMSEP